MATLVVNSNIRDITAMPIVTMFQASFRRIPTFLTAFANDHQNKVWRLPEKNIRFLLKARFV